MLPGALPPALFGLDVVTAMTMGQPEFRVHVLAQICRAALHHRDALGRFVDYRQLPNLLWSLLPEHFGVSCGADERERMRAITRYNAKTPRLPFEDDTRQKQAALSGPARALVERELRPLYEELEAVRRGEEHAAATA